MNSGYYNHYGISSQSAGEKGNITLLGLDTTTGKILYHNWLAFDLSLVDGTIVAATLEIYSKPGNASQQPLIWRDVSTPYSQLGLPGTTWADKQFGKQVFNDLGTGQVFATGVHTAGALNSFTLNTDALTSLNAADGKWAIGGETTAVVTKNPYNLAFGLTHGVDSAQPYTMQLRLEVENPPQITTRSANVPEGGATVLMLGLGMIGLFAMSRRTQPAAK